MAKAPNTLPRPTERRVDIKRLTTDAGTFQPRFGGLMDNHVANLLDHLRQGKELDPMEVWRSPETGDLIVADGHHRLEALKRHGAEGSVRVKVYTCPLAIAMLIPIQENAKSRLALTYAEKANWAWRLVIAGGGHSIRSTALICGVSKRTVANMREVAKDLDDIGETMPESWLGALRVCRGDEDKWTDDDRDERRDAAVARADEQFGAALTELCLRWPEAAADLFERCAGNKLSVMLERLGYVSDEYADPRLYDGSPVGLGAADDEEEVDSTAF